MHSINTFISGIIGSNAGKECQSFFDCLHIALLFSGKAIAKKKLKQDFTLILLSLSHEKQKDQKISCEQYEISSSW